MAKRIKKLDKLMMKSLLAERDARDLVGGGMKKEKKYYVSDMSKCQRMRWVKRKGVKQDFDDFVYWIFEIGNMYHDFAYKVLEQSGTLIESEMALENEHFSGRFDGLVERGDGVAIVDVKSKGGYKMKLTLEGKEDEAEIAQVLTYVMLLNEQGRDDIKSGLILSLNKEPGAKIPTVFHEKEYHLTNWRKTKIQEEMDLMVKFWEDDEVPPCTCPAWMKPYNSFLPFCQMKAVDVKKNLKLLDKEGYELISSKTNLKVVRNINNKKEEKVLLEI